MPAAPASRPHVAVIGAGAFGGWTALWLLRAGARVTLLDPRGAGHPHSSSGDRSRVFRHAYPDRLHVDLARRARSLWLEADRRWGRSLYHERGVLFIERGGDFIAQAQAHLQAASIPFERPTPAEITRRWPMFRLDGSEQALYEPQAGHLDAARACVAVRDAVIDEGGEWLTSAAQPGRAAAGRMEPLSLPDGTRLEADQYVFACGPWLKQMFPGALGPRLRITRQEVHYFEPPGDWPCEPPVWAHLDERFWYGIPGSLFKIADDTRGPDIDPDTQSRSPSPASIDAAVEALRLRFHGFDAPRRRESHVCQYTQTPDSRFVLDRHPRAANAWLLGGGSGHGFKHGPALGELAAGVILGHAEAPVALRLDRPG